MVKTNSRLYFKAISSEIDLERFDCGVNELNDFLKKYALLNHKRHISFTLASQAGGYVIIVDAKNDGAKNFYKKFGFVETCSNPLQLFILTKTLEVLLQPNPTEDNAVKYLVR